MLIENIPHPSEERSPPQPCKLFFEATDMGETGEIRQQLGKRLGQRIAERRKALGWTQDQLAERLGVDAETVSRFERGVTVPALVTLDRLAGLLKSYPDARFLITGYTDARGSCAYNTDLSNRRAKRVYEALLERGVPAAMLKWHGIGKRASIIPVAAGNSVREGDRKVLLERITNMKYWEAL